LEILSQHPERYCAKIYIKKAMLSSVAMHMSFFFLKHAGELHINILRRKMGKDPQSVTDMKGLQPTLEKQKRSYAHALKYRMSKVYNKFPFRRETHTCHQTSLSACHFVSSLFMAD